MNTKSWLKKSGSIVFLLVGVLILLIWAVNCGSDTQMENQTETNTQKCALRIIEFLVKSGHNNDNRALGAIYVLCALTLVSEDARTALPWLFQSVAPFVAP